MKNLMKSRQYSDKIKEGGNMTFESINKNLKISMLISYLSPLKFNQMIYSIKAMDFSGKKKIPADLRNGKDLTKNEKAIFDWKIAK